MAFISILLPTRGRPLLTSRLFESLASNTSLPGDIEVVLYMDDDDHKSHAVTHPLLNITRVIRPHGSPMGKIIGECYRQSSGRYVMLMNDDCVFRSRGWDLRVREAFSFFPDDIAFVYGNDLDQGADVPTFPILSRKACEVMGGVAPDGYLNLHIESHLFDVFRQLRRLGHNRILYLDDVIFEHMHPLVGKSGTDATYIKKDAGFDDRLFVALADERLYIAGKLAGCVEGGENQKRKGSAAPAASVRQLPAVSVIITDIDKKIGSKGDSLTSIISGSDGPPFEVIVADSAAVHLSSLRSGRVRVIDVRATTDFTEFCNRASVEALGDYLVFVSSGIVPKEGWLGALLEAFKGGTGIAIAGCRVIEPKSGRIRHAGIGFYEDGGELRHTYIYRGFKAAHPAVARVREFQAIGGGCMMVRKDIFFRAGGFDAEIEGCEDIGLCLRVRGLGGKVVYTPDCFVYDRGVPEKPPISLSLWKDRIECDLFTLLNADNFSAAKINGRYYIGPSSGMKNITSRGPIPGIKDLPNPV
ncbi:MAG: glycosyltransferase family 2 protein [Deltaproteobacteria bacterium]|nr:glycosyltransferase family 2 protein [Deltaproteobacteria bacterium]